MRLEEKAKFVTAHGLVVTTPADHHPPAESWKVICNGLSIPPGTYDYRVALVYAGHQVVKVILRATLMVDTQGHSGLYAVGGNAALTSMAVISKGVEITGYVTSYMGAYSRLHGDAWLSQIGMFGSFIALTDLFIDGSDVVLRFSNVAGTNQDLIVYGSGVSK